MRRVTETASRGTAFATPCSQRLGLALGLGVALIMPVATALGQEAAPDHAAAAPERPTGIYFQYAFYYPAAPPLEPVAAAREVIKEQFADIFRDVATVEGKDFSKGRYVVLRSLEIESYKPPGIDYLKQKSAGFDAKTMALLVETEQPVLIMDFFIVRPEAYGYLTDANRLAYAVAMKTHAVIWDEDTREMYTPPAWRQKRLPAKGGSVVLANTSMHLYEQEETKNYRAVTMGMRKLGLPDLVLYQLPKAFVNAATALLRLLVEEVARPGPLAPKKAWTPDEIRQRLKLDAETDVPPITLIEGPREAGDPRNSVWTVDFSVYPGEHYHERQAHLLRTLFSADDAVMALWGSREELMKLSEEARRHLAHKKEAIQDGVKPPERLLVKAYVEDEYLWLAVTQWKENDTLSGVLVQPGAEKKAGELLEIPFDAVFDYIFTNSEGEEEGNKTGKFMEAIRKQQGEPPAGGLGEEAPQP